MLPDDITLSADGRDTYEEVKKGGRYKECLRTAGVSTTDIVGRMLLLTKDHHRDDMDPQHMNHTKTLGTDGLGLSPFTKVCQFLPTTNTIMQFAEGRSAKVSFECMLFTSLLHCKLTSIFCFVSETGNEGQSA